MYNIIKRFYFTQMINTFSNLIKFLITSKKESNFDKISLSFSKGNIANVRKQKKIKIKNTNDLICQISFLRKINWCGKSYLENKGKNLYLCLDEAIEIAIPKKI